MSATRTGSSAPPPPPPPPPPPHLVEWLYEYCFVHQYLHIAESLTRTWGPPTFQSERLRRYIPLVFLCDCIHQDDTTSTSTSTSTSTWSSAFIRLSIHPHHSLKSVHTCFQQILDMINDTELKTRGQELELSYIEFILMEIASDLHKAKIFDEYMNTYLKQEQPEQSLTASQTELIDFTSSRISSLHQNLLSYRRLITSTTISVKRTGQRAYQNKISTWAKFVDEMKEWIYNVMKMLGMDRAYLDTLTPPSTSTSTSSLPPTTTATTVTPKLISNLTSNTTSHPLTPSKTTTRVTSQTVTSTPPTTTSRKRTSPEFTTLVPFKKPKSTVKPITHDTIDDDMTAVPSTTPSTTTLTSRRGGRPSRDELEIQRLAREQLELEAAEATEDAEREEKKETSVRIKPVTKGKAQTKPGKKQQPQVEEQEEEEEEEEEEQEEQEQEEEEGEEEDQDDEQEEAEGEASAYEEDEDGDEDDKENVKENVVMKKSTSPVATSGWNKKKAKDAVDLTDSEEKKQTHGFELKSKPVSGPPAVRPPVIVGTGTKAKYQCPVKSCGKVLSSKTVYTNHYHVIHCQYLAYKCDQCGHQFGDAAGLRKHEKIHTDDRRYVCPVDGCQKAFKLKQHLKNHQGYQHPHTLIDD